MFSVNICSKTSFKFLIKALQFCFWMNICRDPVVNLQITQTAIKVSLNASRKPAVKIWLQILVLNKNLNCLFIWQFSIQRTPIIRFDNVKRSDKRYRGILWQGPEGTYKNPTKWVSLVDL